MAVIKIKCGKDELTKKATVEDTLKTLDTIDKLENADGNYDIANIEINYLVELFGNQGISREDLLSLPSEDFTAVMEQVEDIFNTINGVDESDADVEAEEKK